MSGKTQIGIAIVAIVVMIAAAVGYMTFAMVPPSDLDLVREKRTAAGLYEVAIAPEDPSFARNVLHSWIVTVRTAEGVPVEEARISIDGGMPQHGHGLPTAPQVTATLGDGRYRIEGVRFNMAGWWEFRLRIEASGGADDVTFNLYL